MTIGQWCCVIAIAAAAVASDSTDVSGKLEAVRAGADLPALGGAIVTCDGLEGAWVTGVRAAGHDERVVIDDCWNLGSCTKAMTATLVALLIERGDLAWETKLPALLPELAGSIHEGYADVTLVELLTHRAGLEDDTERDGVGAMCLARRGTPTEQRRRLVQAVLSWRPVHAPGTEFLYSSAGFVIAGHVAETAAGKSYEALMQELLFTPLGITTARFAATGSAGRIDQPRGHDDDGLPIEPGAQDGNVPALAPAGTCSLSLADWGKFVSLHLRCAKGDVEVGAITLHAATTSRLHTPFDGPAERYAMGWVVDTCDWAGGDGTALVHAGTNRMWFSVVKIGLAADFAVLVTTNGGIARGPAAADRAAHLLIREHLSHAKSRNSGRVGKQ